MKKVLFIVLLAIISLLVFDSCNKTDLQGTERETQEKTQSIISIQSASESESDNVQADTANDSGYSLCEPEFERVGPLKVLGEYWGVHPELKMPDKKEYYCLEDFESLTIGESKITDLLEIVGIHFAFLNYGMGTRLVYPLEDNKSIELFFENDNNQYTLSDIKIWDDRD